MLGTNSDAMQMFSDDSKHPPLFRLTVGISKERVCRLRLSLATPPWLLLDSEHINHVNADETKIFAYKHV